MRKEVHPNQKKRKDPSSSMSSEDEALQSAVAGLVQLQNSTNSSNLTESTTTDSRQSNNRSTLHKKRRKPNHTQSEDKTIQVNLYEIGENFLGVQFKNLKTSTSFNNSVKHSVKQIGEQFGEQYKACHYVAQFKKWVIIKKNFSNPTEQLLNRKDRQKYKLNLVNSQPSVDMMQDLIKTFQSSDARSPYPNSLRDKFTSFIKNFMAENPNISQCRYSLWKPLPRLEQTKTSSPTSNKETCSTQNNIVSGL